MSRFDEKRAKRAGVPSRIFKGVCASTFDCERPAVLEARRFFSPSDERPFLVMAGSVGCGKSEGAGFALLEAGGGRKTVSVLIGGEAAEVELEGALPTIAWVHAFELVKASTYDRPFWAKVETPELLVIDDVGTMPLDSKGYAAANVANLLCYREAQDRKTLLTTNLSYEQFASDYLSGAGERVRDRMKRHALMFYLVAGESMRSAS